VSSWTGFLNISVRRLPLNRDFSWCWASAEPGCPCTLMCPLEELHRAFMFLRACPCLERAQISAFARLCVLLPGIQPIFSRLQFAYHAILRASELPTCTPEADARPSLMCCKAPSICRTVRRPLLSSHACLSILCSAEPLVFAGTCGFSFKADVTQVEWNERANIAPKIARAKKEPECSCKRRNPDVGERPQVPAKDAWLCATSWFDSGAQPPLAVLLTFLPLRRITI
jgi:hypothetical protein